jgi:hypothetical protein
MDDIEHNLLLILDQKDLSFDYPKVFPTESIFKRMEIKLVN